MLHPHRRPMWMTSCRITYPTGHRNWNPCTLIHRFHTSDSNTSLWTLAYHPAQRSRGFSPWVGEYSLRSRLGANHFEMLTFLRSSTWFDCCTNGKQSNTMSKLLNKLNTFCQSLLTLTEPCSSFFIVTESVWLRDARLIFVFVVVNCKQKKCVCDADWFSSI